MEEEASISVRAVEFLKKNLLFASLIGVGLLLCGVGVIQYLNSNDGKSELKLIKNDPSEQESTSIAVHVEGEVVSPGVYKLKADSRLDDAIRAAGGYTGNEDSEYISKNLNLAQRLSDGSKVYIPAIGELDEDISVLGSKSIVEAVSEGTPVSATGLININNASLESLDTLPRVGPVTAQKIVDNRPYGTVSELVSKKVMGQKTFDGLKERIVAQ